MALRVLQPFASYAIGDEITDPAVITAILASTLAPFVVPIDDTSLAPYLPSWEPTAPLIAFPSSFPASAAQGTPIAVLPDPFLGLGLGVTIYATFGTVPGQLALSGNDVVVGASSAVAGSSYSIGILATSGDGQRKVGETLTFYANASGGTPQNSGVLDASTAQGTGLLAGTGVI